ncbi:MAG TPA: hypothetical protein DDX39_03145 [Bacteroidales bacterium]|nr:MAG: hypothetical protein A2W98_02740 [Bacteroidetes bacterium GWF2_33_38]OFY89202.1 MAG: hypothetical protein A2236_06520 [Bacteroidetes bacterium RIFOXYA2_FULL_33_7]HBF87615.1 hypothetical protein [Bacteroidales bacterium]
MKKKILIFVIVLLNISTFFAQKIPAYFISNNNVTTKIYLDDSKGFFKQGIDIEKFQHRIKYYDSNNEKHFLYPNMAKEINFMYEGKAVQMLSRIMPDGSLSFIQIVIDGKIKVFKRYITRHISSGGGMYGAPMTTFSYDVEKFYLQRDNEMLFRPIGVSFKKDMIEYFYDCPNVVKKIEERIFTIKDIEKIVYEYNETCM